MRIERINENSICCTLTSFDLSVRNLNLRELAYGSEKAKKLFDEMMTKASNEVGFNADNTPIMIEAIPLSSDSIKLIISKVPDPEELDTRFSRFTQNPAAKKDGDNWLNRLTAALLEGAEGLVGQLQKLNDEAKKPEAGAAKEVPAASESASGTDQAGPADQAHRRSDDYRAFSFDDMDAAINACKAATAFTGESMLYRNPFNGQYVLIVECADAGNENFSRACNVIAEYGRMLRTVQNTLSYYEEHYKPIVKSDAIHKLAQI
jgi:adapter protein MecA 1/2